MPEKKIAHATTKDNIGLNWDGTDPNKPKDKLITALNPGEIIVVGTNQFGFHGAGAARYAHDHFGLRWGHGEGLSGQTYALPTMEGIASFAQAAMRFQLFAELAPDMTFLLTKVGCGIAGYDESLVMELFADAPANVIRPEGWPALEASE
jgi:hypothetical protein